MLTLKSGCTTYEWQQRNKGKARTEREREKKRRKEIHNKLLKEERKKRKEEKCKRELSPTNETKQKRNDKEERLRSKLNHKARRHIDFAEVIKDKERTFAHMKSMLEEDFFLLQHKQHFLRCLPRGWQEQHLYIERHQRGGWRRCYTNSHWWGSKENDSTFSTIKEAGDSAGAATTIAFSIQAAAHRKGGSNSHAGSTEMGIILFGACIRKHEDTVA